MCADGYSHTAIAKCLNGDERYNEMLRRYLDGRTPQPPQDGTGSWAPSSIRVMLMRTRYIGRVPYREFKNVSRGGRTGQCDKQEKLGVGRHY